MARRSINTGTIQNDGTGDTLRSAFEKTELNFIEIYDKVANVSINGPYTNDSAASANNVPFKGLYYSADGIVRIRLV